MYKKRSYGECYHCGEKGHWVPECPLRNGEKTNQEENKDTSKDISQDTSQDICYNCQQRGHWASNCQEPKRKQPRKGKCYQCKQEGHWKSECPQKKIIDNQGENSEETQVNKGSTSEDNLHRHAAEDNLNNHSTEDNHNKRPSEGNHRCLNCHQLGHGLFHCGQPIETRVTFDDLTNTLFNKRGSLYNARIQRYWYWCGEAAEYFRRYQSSKY
ncbi:hypothetical protein LOTGIDRAFT_136176 [Lottia gigantea]|uniref:CCHC-type domain-containing protein n=1 Tax=Lottia gigantea TaxID=225164 RepID=V4BAG4_LOTGI|nr:hypothetical protein LOTGIDRAFT_136176 [Lottia gigantea]ESP04466.1 hypothetical protein LOTGIDRAFT_136176 [Lottia gigantea]